MSELTKWAKDRANQIGDANTAEDCRRSKIYQDAIAGALWLLNKAENYCNNSDIGLEIWQKLKNLCLENK